MDRQNKVYDLVCPTCADTFKSPFVPFPDRPLSCGVCTVNFLDFRTHSSTPYLRDLQAYLTEQLRGPVELEVASVNIQRIQESVMAHYYYFKDRKNICSLELLPKSGKDILIAPTTAFIIIIHPQKKLKKLFVWFARTKKYSNVVTRLV